MDIFLMRMGKVTGCGFLIFHDITNYMILELLRHEWQL